MAIDPCLGWKTLFEKIVDGRNACFILEIMCRTSRRRSSTDLRPWSPYAIGFAWEVQVFEGFEKKNEGGFEGFEGKEGLEVFEIEPALLRLQIIISTDSACFWVFHCFLEGEGRTDKQCTLRTRSQFLEAKAGMKTGEMQQTGSM